MRFRTSYHFPLPNFKSFEYLSNTCSNIQHLLSSWFSFLWFSPYLCQSYQISFWDLAWIKLWLVSIDCDSGETIVKKKEFCMDYEFYILKAFLLTFAETCSEVTENVTFAKIVPSIVPARNIHCTKNEVFH